MGFAFRSDAVRGLGLAAIIFATGGAACSSEGTGGRPDSGAGTQDRRAGTPTEHAAERERSRREGRAGVPGQPDADGLFDGAATEDTLLWFTRLCTELMLCASQDNLGRLEQQVIRELEAHWEQGHRILHLEMALVTCWRLYEMRTHEFERRLDLLLRCAEMACEKESLIPPEMAARIVRVVVWTMMRDQAHLRRQVWADSRGRTARLIFRTWRHISGAMDPNYDFFEKPLEELSREELRLLPYGNVVPGGKWPSGVAPECITDPVVRQKYEEAIAENNRKAAVVRRQRELYDLREEFSEWARESLVALYTTGASNTQELRGYIEQYGMDRKIATKVLEAVTASAGKDPGDTSKPASQERPGD